MTTSSDERLLVINLTGGPGGGKSALIQRCAADPALGEHVAVLEEAILGMSGSGLERRSREFQCALVATQIAAEDSLKRTVAGRGRRALITHRGTLDPCAFWQSFGNSRQSFFDMTRSTLQDHYSRYSLVVHLESTAVRLPEAYVRFPHAHRPESIAEAARLDRLLGELWSGHRRYMRFEAAPDIETKLELCVRIIRDAMG